MRTIVGAPSPADGHAPTRSHTLQASFRLAFYIYCDCCEITKALLAHDERAILVKSKMR